MQAHRKIVLQPSDREGVLFSPFDDSSLLMPGPSSQLHFPRNTAHLESALKVLKSHVNLYKRSTQIPLTLNRTQATALFVILKDLGVISKRITDTELAYLLEEHFVYDNHKPLSGLQIEISKLRNHCKNNEMLESFFKTLFQNFKITTKDD